MTTALEATQCPAVQVLSLTVYRGDVMGTNALVAPEIPGAITWRKQANQDVSVLDQVARYGAGLIGVPEGPTKITLATGSTLNLAVSAGHAMIGGPVEIATATTLTVPNNTARVWIWLQQTGAALTYSTTLTPPAGECGLIGSCVTNGGAVVSVDYSGVMYIRGGIGVRYSSDVGAPADTPPSTIQFLAVTAGGSYWWDGTDYNKMAAGEVLTSQAALIQELTDRLDDSDRKFRLLLLGLQTTIGEDFLITDELIDDLDTATAEV